MIIVNVDFTAVEVKKFDRDEFLLRIYFKDGSKEQFVDKTTKLDNIEEFSQTLIQEVRKLEKDINSQKSGEFLGDVTVVMFEDDETLEERLQNVFRRIRDEAKKLRTQKVAQGYLQNISRFSGSKYSV